MHGTMRLPLTDQMPFVRLYFAKSQDYPEPGFLNRLAITKDHSWCKKQSGSRYPRGLYPEYSLKA